MERMAPVSSGASVGDAEVKGVVESLGNLGVRVDDEAGVHGLRADRDVVEVAGLENVEVFLEFGDHDGEQAPGAMAFEVGAELLVSLLLVLSLDDRSFVHADADRNARGLAGVDHRIDLISIADIARVQPDLVHARFDRFEGPFEMKVDVGHDGYRRLFHDLNERLGVFSLRHRDSNDVGTRFRQLLDLREASIDIVGVAGSHRLNRREGVATDLDASHTVVTDGHLPGCSSKVAHGAIVRG